MGIYGWTERRAEQLKLLERLLDDLESLDRGVFLMQTAKDIVNRINSENLDSVYDIDELEGVDDVVEIAEMDFDEHRWYVVGTVVFKVGDEFFGLRGPVSLKSEAMDWSDTGAKCEAFEMAQIPSVTYIRKDI